MLAKRAYQKKESFLLQHPELVEGFVVFILKN